jgi:hypothetical protein
MATSAEINNKNKKEWKQIKMESEKAIKNLEDKLIEFKYEMFPGSFFQFQDEIENDFGELKFDQNFNLWYK